MVNCDIGHGSMPSVFGKIPGTHMIFGGDEWWFYGPRVVRRRPDHREPPAPRLPGGRDEVRRAHRVRAGRQHAREPARRGGVEATVDVGALPRRGGTSSRLLRPASRRPSPRGRPSSSTTLRERRLAWIRSGRDGASPPLVGRGARNDAPHVPDRTAHDPDRSRPNGARSSRWCGAARRISGPTSAGSTAAGSPR